MNDPVKITRTQELTIIECSECSSSIALTNEHRGWALKDSRITFYCPRGHAQHYGDSELDRVKAKLAEQTRIATEQAARAQQAQARMQSAELAEERAVTERNAAQREVKRMKTRAAAGVCPCCNRTFVQLARHMKTKHPEAAR